MNSESYFPHIKIKDNSKILPKYAAALSRFADEQLPAEDLDTIQLELEHLLSTVALRNRVFKLELESLEKDDKKVDRRSKINEKQPCSPGKRKREETRKLKNPHAKLIKQRTYTANSPVQNTDDSMDATPYSSSNHQKEIPKAILHKNDTPNKFWLSVEPYCMPITNEDLKLLDDLLEQHSTPVNTTIPELGQHYATAWALEDLKEEQANSSSVPQKSKKLLSPQGMKMLKKGERKMGQRVTGPLTQRLVSALLEENLIGDVMTPVTTENNKSPRDANSYLRSMSVMKNGICIEKQVKQELITQGILEPSDFTKFEEDEIHLEIKRIMVELTAIADYNKTELRKLQEISKTEIKRLEIKRSLDLIDQEILEAYKKTVHTKSKRRPLSNEEIADLFRLTSEQKKLADQLESIIPNVS